MGANNGPDFAHGRQNRVGRPFGAVTKAKLELRDLLRKGKSPQELSGNIRELAMHHPDGYVRLGALKLWAEYAYGKPINADGVPHGGPTIVRVVTGVREGAAFKPYGYLRKISPYGVMTGV